MKYKTKRRTRDLDLIFQDLNTRETVYQLKNQPIQEDKPGLGQHYCVECSKYFESSNALLHHTKSKVHRRRLKQLRDVPYLQEEADAAAGVGVLKYHELVKKHKQQIAAQLLEKQEIEQLKKARKDETLGSLVDQEGEVLMV